VSECPGKGRICDSQKGRDARWGGQRFFGRFQPKAQDMGIALVIRHYILGEEN
jgi:hypothetical protein